MTTIAANKSSMAADSKVTDDGLSYAVDKIVEINGNIIGTCGLTTYTNRFLEWFKEGCPEAETLGKGSFGALVLNKDGLFYYVDRCPPDKIKGDYYAIGMGAMAAATAMFLGKDPTEAVEIACQVNATHTGGPVQTVHLKTTRRSKP